MKAFDKIRGERRFVVNTVTLLSVQFGNFVVPIALIPFLTRHLGVDQYGVVAFATGVSAFMLVAGDFGTSISTIPQVARGAHDGTLAPLRTAISRARFVTGAAAALLCWSFMSLVAPEHAAYFGAIALGTLAQVLLPTWLFQGIERTGPVAIYTLSSRALYLFGTVALVANSPTLLSVGTAFLVANCTGLALSQLLVRRAVGSRERAPMKESIEIGRRALPFLWSRLAVSGYTSAGSAILGASAGTAAVANFGVADQVYKGAQVSFNPLVQALYPRLAREFRARLVGAMLALSSGAVVLSVAIVWLLAPKLVVFFLGSESQVAIDTLRVMSLALIPAVPSMIIGYPVLGVLGHERTANGSTIAGAVWYGIGASVLLTAGNFGAVSAAALLVSTEVVVFGVRAWRVVQLAGERRGGRWLVK